MNRIRVAVNGYGVIGKRVADAVRLQDDMALAGVAEEDQNPKCGRSSKRCWRPHVGTNLMHMGQSIFPFMAGVMHSFAAD